MKKRTENIQRFVRNIVVDYNINDDQDYIIIFLGKFFKLVKCICTFIKMVRYNSLQRVYNFLNYTKHLCRKMLTHTCISRCNNGYELNNLLGMNLALRGFRGQTTVSMRTQ